MLDQAGWRTCCARSDQVFLSCVANGAGFPVAVLRRRTRRRRTKIRRRRRAAGFCMVVEPQSNPGQMKVRRDYPSHKSACRHLFNSGRGSGFTILLLGF